MLEDAPSAERAGGARGDRRGPRVPRRPARTTSPSYGRRADKWTISAPSWIEDPTPAIKSLRDFVAPARAPTRPGDEAAGRRRAASGAIAEARERLAGYPAAVVGQFEAMLSAAQKAVVLTEDHNFWIDMLRRSPRPRGRCSAVGRRLAADGALAHAEDVLMLMPDELRDALAEPRRRPARRRGRAAAATIERQAARPAARSRARCPPAPPPDDPFSRFDREVLRRAARRGGGRGRAARRAPARRRVARAPPGSSRSIAEAGRLAAGRHPGRRDDRAAVDAAVRDRRPPS